MTKDFWVNIAVKDLDKSKEFFTKIGFSFKSEYGMSDVSACFTVGNKNIAVMLFAEHVFKNIIQTNITDTKQSTEVLFNIDAESREEVDEWVTKVKNAGGVVFAAPAESQGWMYACAFSDLDGHRWCVLHMDMSKMPKK